MNGEELPLLANWGGKVAIWLWLEGATANNPYLYLYDNEF